MANSIGYRRFPSTHRTGRERFPFRSCVALIPNIRLSAPLPFAPTREKDAKRSAFHSESTAVELPLNSKSGTQSVCADNGASGVTASDLHALKRRKMERRNRSRARLRSNRQHEHTDKRIKLILWIMLRLSAPTDARRCSAGRRKVRNVRKYLRTLSRSACTAQPKNFHQCSASSFHVPLKRRLTTECSEERALQCISVAVRPARV